MDSDLVRTDGAETELWPVLGISTGEALVGVGMGVGTSCPFLPTVPHPYGEGGLRVCWEEGFPLCFTTNLLRILGQTAEPFPELETWFVK